MTGAIARRLRHRRNSTLARAFRSREALFETFYRELIAAFPEDHVTRVLGGAEQISEGILHLSNSANNGGMFGPLFGKIIHVVKHDGAACCTLVYVFSDPYLGLGLQLGMCKAAKDLSKAQYAILPCYQVSSQTSPLGQEEDVILAAPELVLPLVQLLRGEALRAADQRAQFVRALKSLQRKLDQAYQGDVVSIGGRPTKQPAPGERMSLGLKVTADIKARLDSAAKMSGRTQSQEAEKRLEQSFEREDLLEQVFTLAYGPETAGLLMMVAPVMRHTGSRVNWLQCHERKVPTDGNWATNGAALWAATRAGVRVLDATSAAIQATFGDGTPVSNERYDAIGADLADTMICAVRGNDDVLTRSPHFGPVGQRAGALLGRVVRALRESEPPF